MFVLFSKEKQRVPVKIWRNDLTEVEQGCIEQAVNASNHPAIFRHVALAPDCHQGYGLPVGGVAAFDGVVSPNCVGVDIACGMLAYPLEQENKELKEDQEKYKSIIKSLSSICIKLAGDREVLEDTLTEVNEYIKSAHGINTIAKGSRLHLKIQHALALRTEAECCEWDTETKIYSHKAGCNNVETNRDINDIYCKFCGKPIKETKEV